MIDTVSNPLASLISPLSEEALQLPSGGAHPLAPLNDTPATPATPTSPLVNPPNNPLTLISASMLVNSPNNPGFLLPPEPSGGFLDYEYSLHYQAGPTANVPTDEVGEIPLAQFFDPYYYLYNNPEVAAAIAPGDLTAAYEHFLTVGIAQGLASSPLYSEPFYLNNNPDVAAAVADGSVSSGLVHFLNEGHEEGRDPSQWFKQSDYLLLNPDVAEDIENDVYKSPFEHYVEEGADAGLEVNAAIASIFNPTFYLENNPDVAAAVANQELTAFEHFVSFGQYEERSPSSILNLAEYSATPEVQAALADGTAQTGFEYYLTTGRS